ncbi:MFS transporter [Erwinia sp. E_sp_B01_9]|uniref:MFS transporter n=1 Tax=Erwinia sp. E_sp_B01_9 TaxID=3039403 RepID=UPI003D9B6D58
MPEQSDGVKRTLSDLLHSGYGKRLVFISLFWTCSVIPVFAVYAFAPRVLQALHLSGNWASYGSVAITMLFVVGCIIATRLVNTMGRRSLLIHSFLWSGIALMLLGLLRDGPSWVILLMFGAYALFIGGAQVLQLVYPNEIFPTDIRAAAVGIGTSMSRIGAAVGTYLVPVSLQSIGIGSTMYIAAGITLVGLIVAWMLAPETRSLDLNQASALPDTEETPSRISLGEPRRNYP